MAKIKRQIKVTDFLCDKCEKNYLSMDSSLDSMAMVLSRKGIYICDVCIREHIMNVSGEKANG